jgi:hypothetical protein
LKTLWPGASDDRARLLQAARAVAEGIPGVRVVGDKADDFELTLAFEEQVHHFYLGNIYEETRGWAEEARVARVERFLLDLFAPKPERREWPDVRGRLVPVVRGCSNFLVGDRRLAALSRPFAPFLVEAVVIDSDAGMEYVNESGPGEWGVAVDEVFLEARQNLAACDDRIEAYEGSFSSPAWYVAIDDDYESSRILLPGWLASFEGKVAGRPVAIVPNRNTLLVGGSEDLELLRHLLGRAEEAAASSPRYVSTMPYTVDEAGEVVPLQVAPEHPLAEPLRHARLLLAGMEYSLQKQHLDAVHEREGTDIFVATYGAFRDQAGREWSYTSWRQGVDSLLPEAEIIALGGDGEGPSQEEWLAFVAWNDLQRLAPSSLLRLAGCEPARYRTVAWPDAEAVTRLRACAMR